MKILVTLHFFHNGWTFKRFNEDEDYSYWVKAMKEKHGRITRSYVEIDRFLKEK